MDVSVEEIFKRVPKDNSCDCRNNNSYIEFSDVLSSAEVFLRRVKRNVGKR